MCPPLKKSARPQIDRNPALVVVAVLGVAFTLLLVGWPNIRDTVLDSGSVYHDQKMWVEAKGWSEDEYKNCTTLNVDLEQPTLHCDDDVVGRVFDVRFYGKTFVQDKPDSQVFHWACQKNVGIDPEMTCRDRK
jgi:hypothetical protein